MFLSLTLLIETFVNGSWLCPGFPGSSAVKESAFNAGDPGLIPWLGRSPGEGIGYPLQILAWRIPDCIVHGVTKSWTQLSDFHLHFHSSVRHNWATYTCPQLSTLAEGGGRESRVIQEGTSILDICVKTESQPGVPFGYELSSTIQTWDYYFEMWCREKEIACELPYLLLPSFLSLCLPLSLSRTPEGPNTTWEAKCQGSVSETEKEP